ncbi:hypothetical protein [Streptomyces sp. NPDC093261]|uniref:hypothetical protein n=1 Tax=Streptomyces sp. NPDC093261 TaxID=3366037 RepID=UPI0037FD81AC
MRLGYGGVGPGYGGVRLGSGGVRPGYGGVRLGYGGVAPGSGGPTSAPVPGAQLALYGLLSSRGRVTAVKPRSGG